MARRKPPLRVARLVVRLSPCKFRGGRLLIIIRFSTPAILILPLIFLVNMLRFSTRAGCRCRIFMRWTRQGRRPVSLSSIVRICYVLLAVVIGWRPGLLFILTFLMAILIGWRTGRGRWGALWRPGRIVRTVRGLRSLPTTLGSWTICWQNKKT